MDVDPAKLLAEARQEPVRPRVTDFSEAMIELRAKGFTFRQIAEWLSQRGLEVDHNAVYRVLGSAGNRSGPKRSHSPATKRTTPTPPAPPASHAGPTEEESPIPL